MKNIRFIILILMFLTSSLAFAENGPKITLINQINGYSKINLYMSYKVSGIVNGSYQEQTNKFTSYIDWSSWSNFKIHSIEIGGNATKNGYPYQFLSISANKYCKLDPANLTGNIVITVKKYLTLHDLILIAKCSISH